MNNENNPKKRLIRIAARPAFSNEDANPYNSLLYKAIQLDSQVMVQEHRYSLRPWSIDIFHLHWPEFDVLPKSMTIFDLAKKMAVWAWIFIAKLFDVKIIWTAHNAFGHDTKSTTLNKFLWKYFLSILDGVIYLSEESKDILEKEYPNLRQVKSTIVKHGHYGPWISNVRHEKKQANGKISKLLDALSTDFLILHFGQIRSYKNVDELMRQFTEIKIPNLRLMIAGNVPDKNYLEKLRSLQQRDPRIILFAHHLDDASLVACLERADLVALPYKKILNSGSALMALSFGAHVIVPAIGSMESLQRDVGEESITLYEGDFSAGILQKLISEIKVKKAVSPNLTEYEWKSLGEKTNIFYRNLIN